MFRFKTTETLKEEWDTIIQDEHQYDGFELTFTAAWKDLLINSKSSNCIFKEKPTDYGNKLAILFSLLKPHFEQSLKNALVNQTTFEFTFKNLLAQSLKNTPEDQSEIYSILLELKNYLRITGNPPELLAFFLETFNDNFIDNLPKYEAIIPLMSEYPKKIKIQPYKLELSLPLETHMLYSRDAAKRLYTLLKKAVEQGILHAAKCIQGLNSDSENIKLDVRHRNYSQFVLYLPDPFDVNHLKKLIYQINQIAREEGVYHNRYEEKCNTHLSGIVSLRNDYVNAGPYKPATDFTASDLAEQNKLPIIKELVAQNEREEKDYECLLQDYIINKTTLFNFYLQVKSGMTKDSLAGQKGKAYVRFESLLDQDKLKTTEVELYLKLLLKIILQCDRSRFSLHTSTGDFGLKLLNSDTFLALKKVISSENRKLAYEDLAKFCIDDNENGLTFFSSKNKKMNIAGFKKEMGWLGVVRKMS